MSAVAPSTPKAATRDPRIAGLYAVTPDIDDTERLVAMVDAALRGGATLVQYRNKTADPALRSAQAARLATVCAGHRAPLIVNDHADLALAIDDAGLHVGSDDVTGPEGIGALRRRLGPSRILGVSCYRSVVLARAAVDAGADYVAFGSVFASSTKPTAPAAALATFDEARAIGIATVGIGGITHANLPSLIAAGADAAAVINALFGDPDPRAIEASARRLSALYRTIG